MSENIQPQQQFYFDHAQRGPDAGAAMHPSHHLSGTHPTVVCISQTINNVVLTFPASYPGFRRGSMRMFLQQDTAKMYVLSLISTFRDSYYDIVSELGLLLVLMLAISENFRKTSQI